jgi:hypothetical protein
VLIVDCRLSLSVVAVVFSGFRVSVICCWLWIVCVCCRSVFPLSVPTAPILTLHMCTVKKVSDFPVPSRDVTNLAGNNLIIPVQEEFGL